MKKNSQLQAIQQLIAGIQKRLTSGSLVLVSKTYTGPQLVAVLQPLADALAVSIANRAVFRKSVADEKAAFAEAHAFLTVLHQAIYVSYGNAADALADFGLAPLTRHAPTAAVKAAAAAKARATRKARGEVGSRQQALVDAPAPEAGTSNEPAAVTVVTK